MQLNARNVLGPKQRSAAMKWQLLIEDALNNRRSAQDGGGEEAMDQERDVFRCVMSKQMVGIFVSVWTRSGLRRHVRHAGASTVGAGVLGRLGNKVSGSSVPRTVYSGGRRRRSTKALA